MDTAVGLVLANLRVNSYVAVAEYPGGAGSNRTWIAAHPNRPGYPRDTATHPAMMSPGAGCPPGTPYVIVDEFKESPLRINRAMLIPRCSRLRSLGSAAACPRTHLRSLTKC